VTEAGPGIGKVRGRGTPSSSEGISPARELEPAEAFRLWAPTYERETGLSVLEEQAASRLVGSLTGRRLLDVGCGTGRRLVSAVAEEAALVVGVDLVPEMLQVCLSQVRTRALLVAGDLRAIPLPDGGFDRVWCRLTLGFVPDPLPAMSELARVVRVGGEVLVTDLHPACAERGDTRTFRDAAGVRRRVRHHLHAPETQIRLAGELGLRLKRRLDLEIGPAIRRFYREARALDRYEADRGRPALLALLFVRE